MSTPTQTSPPSASPSGRGLRVKIVVRRFWPFSGSREFQVSELAASLAQAGHSVEVLTIRWNKSWPARFRYRGCNVVRLQRPHNGPWGSYRYLRALKRQAIRDAPDGIIIFGLDDELSTIHRTYQGKLRYVVCLNEHDLGRNPDASRLSRRQVLALSCADRLIAESRWTADRLGDLNLIDPTKVVVAGNGIEAVTSDRSEMQRSIARRAFAEAHPMLVIPDGQPLAVCVAPMVGDVGILNLVKAWQTVNRQQANARLWIVGEGNKSIDIWNCIVKLRLNDAVIMPGQFDNLDDLVQAADLLVHPVEQPIWCGQSLRCLSSGMPGVLSPAGAVALGVSAMLPAPGNIRIAADSGHISLAQALLTALKSAGQTNANHPFEPPMLSEDPLPQVSNPSTRVGESADRETPVQRTEIARRIVDLHPWPDRLDEFLTPLGASKSRRI